MRIQATLSATLDKLTVKFNPKTDTRMAVAEVSLLVGKTKAETILGRDFAELVFSPKTLVENDETGPRFRFAELKPAMVAEFHWINVGDSPDLKVQPVLKKVTPVSREAAVTVTLDLPIELERNAVAAKLAMSVGDEVSFTFKPQQRVLPFAALDGEA